MNEGQIVNPGQKLLLEERSNLIRERIKGRSLYGLTVDLENEDMVLCAAYLLGRADSYITSLQSIRTGPSEHKKGVKDDLSKV